METNLNYFWILFVSSRRWMEAFFLRQIFVFVEVRFPGIRVTQWRWLGKMCHGFGKSTLARRLLDHRRRRRVRRFNDVWHFDALQRRRRRCCRRHRLSLRFNFFVHVLDVCAGIVWPGGDGVGVLGHAFTRWRTWKRMISLASGMCRFPVWASQLSTFNYNFDQC